MIMTGIEIISFPFRKKKKLLASRHWRNPIPPLVAGKSLSCMRERYLSIARYGRAGKAPGPLRMPVMEWCESNQLK
jgi:hypothetical protein